MRWLLLILLTLILGFILGPMIQSLPGSVLIVFEESSVQFRLWVGLVILLSATLLLVFLYHLIIKLLGSAGRLQRWSGTRRFTKARQKTIRGMIALAEGHWAHAEKLLSDAASNTDTALINYLAAAQAAEAQNAHERRDQYLRLAHIAEPSAEVAVGLTQAQLQYRHNQIEEALATLTHLQRLAPKHGPVILLLSKLYQKIGEWQRVIDLLPDLQKSKAMPEQDYNQMVIQIWQGYLTHQASTHGVEGIQTVWNMMPKKIRQLDAVQYLYFDLLINNNASLEAVKGLMQRIKKDNAGQFLHLFGSLDMPDLTQQLNFIEKLGDKFNHSYDWSMAAGKLALKCQIWGQAKNYLEQALKLKPSDEGRKLLALAMDALGMQDQAYQQFKDSWPAQYPRS